MTTLIQRLFCWLGSHAYVRSFERDEAGKVLRVRCLCVDCGRATAGWELGERAQ